MTTPRRAALLACLALAALAYQGCWSLDNPIDPALCGDDSCAIAGQCYPRGGTLAGDTCRACDPVFSRFTWAPAPGCMITLAGTREKGIKNGPAATARFHYAVDLAVASPGEVYVVEGEKHVIRKIMDGEVTTWAGSGKKGSDDGPLLEARFDYPSGLAFGPKGDLFVGDPGNGGVRRISGGKVTLLAGGSWGDRDGVASTASFRNPTGVAVDSGGGVFVSDSESHVIRRIKAGKVYTVAGQNPNGGKPQSGYADGKGTVARFNMPIGIDTDPSGNLFIGDIGNCAVRMLRADRTVLTIAGQKTGCLPSSQQTCADGGALSKASLAYPIDVAMAREGRVLVADENCNRIRQIHNGVVTTLAGGDDWNDKDGPIGKARLYGPTGVDVDSAGYIYVLDGGNLKIKVFKLK